MTTTKSKGHRRGEERARLVNASATDEKYLITLVFRRCLRSALPKRERIAGHETAESEHTEDRRLCQVEVRRRSADRTTDNDEPDRTELQLHST